jgi:hypothetical protein
MSCVEIRDDVGGAVSCRFGRGVCLVVEGKKEK